ncbi:hypothetical protein ACET98_07060 [Aeromonas veronii]
MVDQIPEPNDDGSSGEQVVGSDLNLVIVPQHPIGSPIEKTLLGLASSNSKGMGGEVVANLVAGSFSHITHELSHAKSELSSERAETKLLRERLEAARVEIADLKSRLNFSERGKLYLSFSLVAGPTFISIGIDQIRGGQSNLGWLLVLSGVSSLIVGWFSYGRGK